MWLLVLIISSISAELVTEPVVELRWDFSSCGQTGRMWPSQVQCDLYYSNTNLDGDVTVTYGIQTWNVLISGLYLITARAPSGLSVYGRTVGRGAVVTSEFRLNKGEKLKILVGQKSDYSPTGGSTRGAGGSGGTYVTRESDSFVMLVAGGGSSSAGRNPPASYRSFADAALQPHGKPGSRTPGIVDENAGVGGRNGSGGGFGVMRGITSSGGGAGYFGNGGASRIQPNQLLDVDYPQPAYSFTSKRVPSRGAGGFFQFIDGIPRFNHGGFGGGGAGSADGGAGGGGGYSGGAGGPPEGWGGGGGSINNGEMSKKSALHDGDGSVTISFIGYACCGPIVVYIAMCFVAGIICAMLAVFMAFRCFKCVNRYRSGDQPLWGKTKKGFYSVFKGNKEIETFGIMNNESRYPDRSHENNHDTIPRERSYSYDHQNNHDREKVRRDRSRERRRERRRRRYSSSSHEADVHDRDHRNSRRDTRDSRDQRRRERRRRSFSSDI